MRPANLIPVEERRDRGRGFGSAPVAYAIVAALLIAVGAVTLLVVTDNQISTRKAEVAEAKERAAAAEARATELAAYTQFHATSQQRVETVSNLAKSRFDWEKVMRQLALVLPDDVRITNLTGTVRPDVSVGGGETLSLRGSIPGPALSMSGCAAGQPAVAGFITALKDIDGVTRVGVQNSSNSGGGGSESASTDCGGGETSFQMVVAFDAAPIPTQVASLVAGVEEPAAEEASGSGESAEAPESAPEGE